MRPDLAAVIDHTLLAPDASEARIEQLCREARDHAFGAVCVNSCHVAACHAALQRTAVRVVSTVGFPLGASSTAAKVAETTQAVADGASEIDMVVRLDALKDGDREIVFQDIVAVVRAAAGHAVKVILECSALNELEKKLGAELTQRAGAAYVKTSTGFGAGGATVSDVHLLRSVVGSSFGVKASGGIRDTATAEAMLAAGANRLGTSSGVQLVTGSPT